MNVFAAAAGAILVSAPFILDDPRRMDFWTWPEFSLHFAYLDAPQSEIASPFIGIEGRRRADGSYRLEMTGIEPSATASHRDCRKHVEAVSDGYGLVGSDPSGEFGKFALRVEGDSVRLSQIEPGACSIPGIYMLPKPVD